MKKTANTLTTALTTGSTADRIHKVQQELSTLNKISDRVYNTADKTVINVRINECNSIETLLELDASIKTMQASYDSSLFEKIQKGYIKEAKPFAIAGVSADGIIADIDLRLQILSTEESRKFLAEVSKGYEELMDKDDKLAMLDAKLNAYLHTSNGSK
jgi:hypothetical protein